MEKNRIVPIIANRVLNMTAVFSILVASDVSKYFTWIPTEKDILKILNITRVINPYLNSVKLNLFSFSDETSLEII